jgi:hypothetical protein
MPERPLAKEQVLAMLAEGPRRIAELTRGLDPALLRTPPAHREWSATDVLAHLRSCADVWGRCIETILAEDRPTLRAVNPRTWVRQTNYHDLEFSPSLRSFTRQRASLLAVLEALSPGGWLRGARVTGAGKPRERTVMSYAQGLALHERPHLKQIARIVKTLRP